MRGLSGVCEALGQGQQEVLWNKIISDEYTTKFPMNWPNLFWVNFRDLATVAWNGTMSMFFDRFSDENPTNHAKVIHTYGSVATVRFEPVPNNLNYTGVFREGTEHGIMRLSIVADWTKPCKGGTDLNFNGCFKPSLAFKMLRAGDYSSNLVAQVNLGDGVGRDFNFFNHTQATWLPTPTGLAASVVKELFSFASEKDEISGVGLQELASGGSKADQDASEIKAPKLVYFVPHDDIKHRFSSEEHDARHDFDAIGVGTVLYKVVAVDDDPACFVSANGNPLEGKDLSRSECPHTTVGQIVTTSRFVASSWGDRRLFFQHERLKTKDGRWERKACALDGKIDSVLPDSNQYRMSDDPSRTCTQKCLYPDMKPVVASCPFAKLR